MHPALHLSAAMVLALGACARPGVGEAPRGARVAPEGYAAAEGAQGLVVTRAGQPFGYADGAEAKRAANAYCGPRGVASGDLDNFREGAWLFPGGCA